MESGLKYMISKEGLIKLLVIIFGCITFAMIADTKFYGQTRTNWIFAAFIVSCAISVIFYIFRVTGVANKMGTCGPCTFDGFDFLWAWFCTVWCLAAAIIFATIFPDRRGPFTPRYNKLIVAIVFAFATGITYAIEAYYLRSLAPANLGYVSTRRGWLKTILVALGAAAFGLLVDSGYAWCGRNSPCYAGITYALVAFVVGWAITTIIWLIHISGLMPSGRRDGLRKFEFAWSVFCVLLFFSASACFIAYSGCRGNRFRNNQTCQQRLGGTIIGFIAGVLYIVDAVLNKP